MYSCGMCDESWKARDNYHYSFPGDAMSDFTRWLPRV